MRLIPALLPIATLVTGLAFADTLRFRDGHTVNGSFVAGDSRNIRIAVGDRIETYPISEIDGITFGGGSYSSSYDSAPRSEPIPPPVYRERPPEARETLPPPPPSPPPAPQRSDRSEIAPGTVFTVRMIDDVDSQRDTVGQTYRASLDEPVMDSSGRTVVTRGTDVQIKLVDDKQSGKIEGKTVLTLDVVSLRIDGRDVPIDTAEISQESGSRTARSAKVIGGTAVLGTIIGAIAGGGKGAAIGAASGAGVGTAAQVMTKGQRVRIPSETRLTFTLQQPVRL